jgi:hypothetical protein
MSLLFFFFYRNRLEPESIKEEVKQCKGIILLFG